MPALARGDRAAAARVAAAELGPCYRQQRAGVDKLVEIAQRETDAAEAAGTRYVGQMLLGVSLAATVAIVALLILARWIALRICRRVDYATAMLRDLSAGEGDLRKRLQFSGADELAEMGRHFNHFMENIQSIVRNLKQQLAVLQNTSGSLSSTSAHLAVGARDVTSQSNLVAAAAEQLAENMQAMTASSERMSDNVKSVSNAVSQMTASIDEISRSAGQAAHVAGRAEKLADQSNQNIHALGTAAEEIGKVVELIQAIAEQTNLLALNATIEAARAGTAGKGFAVVATEVKDLARQTAAATEDIRRRIASIQQTSSQAVQAVVDIGTIIHEVSDVSRTIASAVEEQSAVTKEIAQNVAQSAGVVDSVATAVAQSATATHEISANIHSVHDVVQSITQSATSTQDASDQLAQVTHQLTANTDRFHVDDRLFDAGPVKAAHQKWRSMLADMIAGRSTLQTREVKDHTQCEFGKWYYRRGQETLGDLELFQHIGCEHEKVHAIARQVVEIYNAGNHREAARKLGDIVPLTDKLCGMLDQLEEEADQAALATC